MSWAQNVKTLFETQVRSAHRVGIAGELVNAAAVNLFQVQGGDCAVYTIYGKVRVLMSGVNTTVQLRITPTGGVAQALSAASAFLNATAVNSTIMPTGALGVAPVTEITFGVSIGNVGGTMPTNTWVLLPGVIDILVATTNAAGAIDWNILYVPLQPGAVIFAI